MGSDAHVRVLLRIHDGGDWDTEVRDGAPEVWIFVRNKVSGSALSRECCRPGGVNWESQTTGQQDCGQLRWEKDVRVEQT